MAQFRSSTRVYTFSDATRDASTCTINRYRSNRAAAPSLFYAYYRPCMPHRFVHPLINTLPMPRRSMKFGAVPLRSKQNYSNIIASIETRTRDIRSDVCPSKYLRSSDMIGYDSTDSMTRSVIDKYFFFFRVFRGRARAGRRRGTRITTRLGAVTPGNRTCLAYAFAWHAYKREAVDRLHIYFSTHSRTERSR